MATSTLKFYKSEILIPGKNAMYSASANNSQFETYLQTCWRETVNNFQYIKHDLFVSIKVAKPQSAIAEIDPAYPYNYVSIKNSDDDRTFYYFIAAANWKAQMTVELSLAMDTVATYWDQISFNDKTTLIREHKDRFVVPNQAITDNTILVRKVDATDEGVSGAEQIKDQVITIKDTELPNSSTRIGLENLWYLIYRSEFAGTDKDQNPVECYLCADEDLICDDHGEDISWKTSSLDPRNFYFAVLRDNNNGEFIIADVNSNIKSYTLGQSHSSNQNIDQVIKLYYDTDDNYWVCRVLSYYQGVLATQDVTNNVVTIAFNNDNFLWVSSYTQDLYKVSNYNTILNDYAVSSYASKIRLDIQFIASIKSFDRTDSRLLKIIELPYCPTGMTYLNGLWDFPSDQWILAGGALKLKDLNIEFERTLGTYNIPNMAIRIEDVNEIKPNYTRNDILESKIYHSSISPLKFVYDSFVIEYARERYTSFTSNSATNNIYFKQTNTINSKLGFKVTTTTGFYNENQDFETYLLATRNNESMIYNSEYLNYIRNGYNYDKKANSLQAVQSIINSVIGIDTSIARMRLQGDITSKIPQGKSTSNQEEIRFPSRYIINWARDVTNLSVRSIAFPVNAASVTKSSSSVAASLGIGALNSGLSSVVSTAFTIAQNQNSMEGKLAQLKAQSISTAGSDDLDLMKWYSDNTLKEITYKPVEPVKEALLDMFYYAGYSCNNIKGLPDMYSRTNWNFIQCEPVLQPVNETNIYQKYLDDIKERFAIGLTVFHNATDFNQVSNNTEISIANKIAQ